MKIQYSPIYAVVFLSMLMTTPHATAMNLCTSAVSDSDGDGWGWENDASCLVDPATAKQPTPTCVMESSDPDGDGWGWENDASCITDATTTPTPGTSVSDATNVAVDSVLENMLTSDSETHWYSLDIGNGEFAFELSDNRTGEYFDEIRLQLEDVSGEVKAQIDYFGYAENANAFCLDPGRYFLSVSAYYYPDQNPIAYNASLKSTKLRCARPEYTVTTGSYSEVFTTIVGGYAYAGINGELIAVTHDGQPLWSIDNILEGYITGVTASDDNTLYAYNDRKITAVSSTGDQLWTYTMRGGNYLDHVASDSRGVYLVVGNGKVIGLDLSGQEQWLVSDTNNGSVESIEIGDDGTLYLRGYNSVSILRPQ